MTAQPRIHGHVFEWRWRPDRMIAHELLGHDQTKCGLMVNHVSSPESGPDIWYSDHERDDVVACVDCGTESTVYRYEEVTT